MRLSKSKIFLILCLGFIAGVFAGKYLTYEIMAIAAMIFVMAGSLGWGQPLVRLIAFTGLVVILGALRFDYNFRQNDLAGIYGQKIEATGQILDEPDIRPDKTFLTVSRVQIRGQSVDSKIILNLGRFPEYEYGQKIAFSGKLAKPADADEPGGFSYKNYLSRFGVDGIIYYPQIEVTEDALGDPVKYYLFKFKSYFVSRIAEIMPEPQNSFLAGLLIGLRKSIPTDLTDALAATGTTHVIAISGFNITIIATVVNEFLLRFFRRKISFWIALVSIFLFVVMAGASASAVRAGIMGMLGMLALRLGRVNAISNAVALTAVIMLVINPQILHFDAGFQLSFLALLGLVYLTPLLEQKFSAVPQIVRAALFPTIGAYIFTLPFLLHEFGRLSLVAIPVNFLVLPMVPFAMLFGFLTGVAALVTKFLAYPLMWLAWGSLTYILSIIKFAAHIPYASFEFHLNSIDLAIAYVGLVCGIIYLWNRLPKTFSNF